jgi:uncharacterized protein
LLDVVGVLPDTFASMNNWQLALFGAAALASSVFSGIAGAGAGFIMTPLAIFLGLSPAQAVSSGKFNGLATTIGSLSSLRAKGAINKGRVAAIMALALVVGLFVPYVIRALDGKAYRIVLGVMILLMIPVLIHKKVGHEARHPSRLQKGLGGILLTASLFLQGAFSGGLGSLVNIVLMGMLGQTANEAHITKRWSQLVLNVTIIFGILGDRLVVWPVVAVGVCTNLVGSHIGGRIATHKGDKFAMDILLVLMAISSVALIAGAF